MLLATFVLWKLITALLLWATSLIMFVFGGGIEGQLFWWIFLTFMAGCGFFVSWQNPPTPINLSKQE
jgi:hypothetical protein